MDPPVLGVDQLRQRVEIGALELGKLAMLQQERGERVLLGQLLEHVLRGAPIAAGSLLERRQLELLEEHLAELRARVDIERPAGQLVHVLLERRQPLGEIAGQLPQPPGVNLHPGALHPGQDRDQGPFHLLVQLPEPLGLHLRGQDRLDPPGGVGVLAGVLGHFRHVDLVHPPLLLPLADQVGDRDHRVPEQPLGKLVEVVVSLAALQQIGEHHGVGDRPGDFHPGLAQGKHVVLDVLPDLLDRGIGQDRLQPSSTIAGSRTRQWIGPRTGR